MIGKWTRCNTTETMPAEGEPVIFVRPATPNDVAVPLLPFEPVLGEQAEIVPAVFVSGAFVQQNGHVQQPSPELWWTSLPPSPGRGEEVP